MNVYKIVVNSAGIKDGFPRVFPLNAYCLKHVMVLLHKIYACDKLKYLRIKYTHEGAILFVELP